MGFNFSDIFFCIVIFQLLFLSFFLFTQGGEKRMSTILLGCFFLSLCLNLIDVFLLMKRVYFTSPGLAGWGNCLPLVFGPFLYLYTCSLLTRNFQMKGKQWLHFVPFFVFFICTESYWLSTPTTTQRFILERILQRDLPVSVYIASSLIFIQFLLYILTSLRLIRKYGQEMIARLSDYNRVNTSWLYSTIIFFTILMTVSMFNGTLGLTSWSRYYYIAFTVLIFAIMVFVNKVLLGAMRKPGFLTVGEEIASLGTTSTSNPKYLSSTLADADKQKYSQQVLEFMANEKPYLEPELTLEQLAGKLSLRPKILSQVINETLGQNFFDFINRYRIEEAKRLLTNPADKKITVLEVLYEVGFNSKSSFNTLFKKHTGLTPSDFKKNHMNS